MAIDTSSYCQGCGQKFRPTLRRASYGDDALKGREEFCLWCHIEDYRASELFDEPLECEAEVRATITARCEALRAGWRFICDRVAPRKRAFFVSIVRPDGTVAEVIGQPDGLCAYSSQESGRARMIFHAGTGQSRP